MNQKRDPLEKLKNNLRMRKIKIVQIRKEEKQKLKEELLIKKKKMLNKS
jgi:hypothetical protein